MLSSRPLKQKFWTTLAHSLPYGKKVGPSIYVHRSALPQEALTALVKIEQGSLDGEWNLARLPLRTPSESLSLMNYPGFNISRFPVLQRSVNIKIKEGSFRVRNYYKNRPILHRCELMVAPSHPLIEDMRRVTQVCEDAGMFRFPPGRIGFEDFWNRALRVHELDPFPTEDAFL